MQVRRAGILVERHHGRVPGNMEELLALPGVGRKTANLVLILSFKSRKNICVDTHVHRISNRLGLGEHPHAGRDRAGALPGDECALVAVHQPVSGDLGPERVPTRVSAVRNCVLHVVPRRR